MATVTAPFAVKPEVAVINPDIVGVAVQLVPVTVKLPPRLVKLLPDTVKVLSSVVAPCSVSAPGVVDEPMVLIDEAPLPKVLVSDEPVPIVLAPVELSVVKAPEDGVLAPTVVPLILPPVAVKVPAVMEFEALLKVSVLL